MPSGGGGVRWEWCVFAVCLWWEYGCQACRLYAWYLNFKYFESRGMSAHCWAILLFWCDSCWQSDAGTCVGAGKDNHTVTHCMLHELIDVCPCQSPNPHCFLQGDTKVVALPTNTPLNFSSCSSIGSQDSLPLAVPAAAWWPLVLPDSGLDVLSCDHLGGSSSSSGSNGSRRNGSSGSNGSSVFVALVDSDDAPDGEVVLIHAAAPDKALHDAQPHTVRWVNDRGDCLQCSSCRFSMSKGPGSCLACALVGQHPLHVLPGHEPGLKHTLLLRPIAMLLPPCC